MLLEQKAGLDLQQFLASLAPDARIHVFTDADCDGLPAAVLLVRALRLAGYTEVTVEARRKGESAWLPDVLDRLAARRPEALFVLDLGARPEALLPGVPACLIDHHVPGGIPPGATLITGYGTEPVPTTGLLVFWAVRPLLSPDQHAGLLWLAALSLLSDLGDKAPFAELPEARKLYSAASMRDAVSLLNAPRRTATGDASAALDALMAANGPKDVSKIEALLSAKAEVSDALAEARKGAPKFAKKHRDELGGDLVAIAMNTPCQVHPLIAQTWRGRFPKSIVMGVNFGFRPGFVHFSARGPSGQGGPSVIEFLRAHAPAGVDQGYGNGHDRASGGAVPFQSWNAFVDDLGFGPALYLPESAS